MGVALDNSEFSGHIVELLTASITGDLSSDPPSESSRDTKSAVKDFDPESADLPAPSVMVSRLYLLSDILHNR